MDEKTITKIRQQFTAAVLSGDEKEKKLRLSIGDLIDKYSLVEKTDIEKVRPWCHEDFLARLRTFQLAAAWFAKPSMISALECARHGWCNHGIDELKCHSCGINIFHTKEDHNGTVLRTQLCTGHLPHCGWNENFCSLDFLRFPVVAPSTLQLDFLMRLRALVDTLTLTFPRIAPSSTTTSGSSTWHFDVSESIRSSAPKIAAMLLSQGSNTANRDDHRINNNHASSSSTATNIRDGSHDSRIVVTIGTEPTVSMTTTEHTDPTRNDRLTGIAATCPSRLPLLRERAMTAIDTLRSRWSTGQGLGGSENVVSGNVPRLSTNGSGTFLDDLSSTLLFSTDFDQHITHPLAPDTHRDNNATVDRDLVSHVESSSNRAALAFSEVALLRACVLLALCGWMPVTTTTPTGTASTSSSGNGNSTASCSGGDRGSDNVAVSFRCNVCGRTFPMTCFLAPSSSSSSSTAMASSHIDPLSQHRAFCLWARAESINSSPSHHEGISLVTDLVSSIPSMPGWLHCAHAMTDIDSPPSASSSAPTISSLCSSAEQGHQSQQRQSSSLISTSLGKDHQSRINVPTSMIHTSTSLPSISQDHSSEIQSNSSSSNIDAEQAYKKIKLVLDMATTTTTKPLPNRTQPY